MGNYNQLGGGCYELQLSSGMLFLAPRVTNRTKARYEDWLEGTARRRVFQLRHELSPEEFKESMAAVVEESAAHTLAWGGPAWDKSLKQLPGIVQILVLLANDKEVRQEHPQQKADADFFLNVFTKRAEVVPKGDALLTSSATWVIIDSGQELPKVYSSEKEALAEAEVRMNDYEADRTMLSMAMQQILHSTPNFLSPPTRGADE